MLTEVGKMHLFNCVRTEARLKYEVNKMMAKCKRKRRWAAQERLEIRAACRIDKNISRVDEYLRTEHKTYCEEMKTYMAELRVLKKLSKHNQTYNKIDLYDDIYSRVLWCEAKYYNCRQKKKKLVEKINKCQEIEDNFEELIEEKFGLGHNMDFGLVEFDPAG